MIKFIHFIFGAFRCRIGSSPELSMWPPSPILYFAAAFGPGTLLEVMGHMVVTGINASKFSKKLGNAFRLERG